MSRRHKRSAVGARPAGDHSLSVKPRSFGRSTRFWRFLVSARQDPDAWDRSQFGLLQRLWKGVLALLSAFPAPVFAIGQEGASASLQPPIGSGDILSVGASLVLVVAAIVLCGWLYSRSQGLRARGDGIINIIATQPLGPKERILLIEVADKQLVVGMTSTQVSTLHVFDQPVLRHEPGAEQRVNFGERLKAMLKGDAK